MPAAKRDRTEGPLRTCVVTGVEAAPEALLRFALSPDGVVTPDIARRLPGRGVWTKPDRATVQRAVQRKAFSRGFKREATVAADLPDLVDRLLEEDALGFLSFVNKAGLAIAGAMKVEAAIRSRAAVALLQASDGAVDGADRLERLAQGVYGERSAGLVRINIFKSGQMDLAFGRSNVVHAALIAGPTSTAFLVKVARLVQYRSGETPEAKADIHAVVEFAASSAQAEASEV